MLSWKLKKQLKSFDLTGHSECCHDFRHYPKKQCEWDKETSISKEYLGNSNRICNMYICTICGGEYWSNMPEPEIEHYTVKEVRKCQKKN